MSFHGFGNNVTTSSVSSTQSFTDLSLSHLANSWNQESSAAANNPAANTTVATPSITLTSAVQAAAASGMTHTYVECLSKPGIAATFFDHVTLI